MTTRVPEAAYVKEYVVCDYDWYNIVYQGTDRSQALKAWDKATSPDCWVNECRTYREALR
jgi:hypothetical protein